MTAPTRRRRLGILGAAAAAVTVALVVAIAAPASAHVRVEGNATAGGYAVLTFRVPTESDTASITSLSITFPADTPIASVSTLSKAGWTANVETADLATPLTGDDGNTITTYVSKVTWTTTGAGIKPGEYDTFAVLAGPIPDAGSIAFPAAQGYSDGTVVDWNQIAQGATVPEHPAPVITVAPAADKMSGATASASPDASAAGTGDSGAGYGLGLGGLIAGVLALIIAIIALVRSGRGKAAESK